MSFLLCNYLLSEVTQSCPTLCEPMDCSISGFSVHGIFQAGVLEWGAIAISGELPRPSNNRQVPELHQSALRAELPVLLVSEVLKVPDLKLDYFSV